MPTSDWRPEVADVGGVLRARTKDTNGVELGTFTEDTRPTDNQVEIEITQAAGDVASAVGAVVPDETIADAKAVTALGAAMLVELSFFPEQVATGRSPYDQLKDMYEARLTRLRVAVQRAGGNTPDPTDDRPAPAYAFPMTGAYDIVGRVTAW